jgi:N-acetylglucosaminyldiphosphoundecaprenol N-acetyl-beta-D-mannosaminyltransferase
MKRPDGWRPCCRLCGAAENQRLIGPETTLGGGQDLIRCGSCGCLYLDPLPTAEALDRFYRQEYRRLFPAEAARAYDSRFFTDLASDVIARRRAELLLSPDVIPDVPAARILEIGSGFGCLQGALHRLAPQAVLTAVEPDEARRTCGTGGAPVRFLPLEAALAQGPYERIVLFHVLEHLPDPAGLLRQLAQALTPDGRLVVEVPDAGAAWSGWQDVHPAHLSYFTGPGLDRLFRRCGWRVVDASPLLPGTLLRQAVPDSAVPDSAVPAPALTELPPSPAPVSEIAGLDAHVDRYRPTAAQKLRRLVRNGLVRLLGVETVGALLRRRRRIVTLQQALPCPPHRSRLMGFGVDGLTAAEVIARMEAAMQQRHPLQVADINVAKFIEMRRNPSLALAVEAADIVCPDGMGIVWAARALGVAMPERVTGIDLMQSLLDLCARKGYRPYVLGAQPDVLAEALDRLQARFPALTPAGSRNGYYPPDAAADIAAEIRDSGADCLIVAMGSPRQELFLQDWHRFTGVPVAMMVGGSLDVMAGRFRRAPVWMQRAGLEWFARLVQDPRRLWKRYAVTNSRFLLLLLGYWLRALVRRGR